MGISIITITIILESRLKGLNTEHKMSEQKGGENV